MTVNKLEEQLKRMQVAISDNAHKQAVVSDMAAMLVPLNPEQRRWCLEYLTKLLDEAEA